MLSRAADADRRSPGKRRPFADDHRHSETVGTIALSKPLPQHEKMRALEIAVVIMRSRRRTRESFGDLDEPVAAANQWPPVTTRRHDSRAFRERPSQPSHYASTAAPRDCSAAAQRNLGTTTPMVSKREGEPEPAHALYQQTRARQQRASRIRPPETTPGILARRRRGRAFPLPSPDQSDERGTTRAAVGCDSRCHRDQKRETRSRERYGSIRCAALCRT